MAYIRLMAAAPPTTDPHYPQLDGVAEAAGAATYASIQGARPRQEDRVTLAGRLVAVHDGHAGSAAVDRLHALTLCHGARMAHPVRGGRRSPSVEDGR